MNCVNKKVRVYTETIKEDNLEGVIDALYRFGRLDDDFNGNNGNEYLLEEARDNGYDSNLDYTIEQLKDKLKSHEEHPTPYELCQEFFFRMIGTENLFDFELVENEQGALCCIALAVSEETNYF